MQSADITIRNGVLDLRINSHANNIYGDYPAILLGNTNNVNAGRTPGRGVVLGVSNELGTFGGYAAMVGHSNKAYAYNSLVVGSKNELTKDATQVAAVARYSTVLGYQNKVPGPSDATFVSGSGNTVLGNNIFAAGSNHTVQGPVIDAPTNNSAALGEANLIASNTGWAMGACSSVSGDQALALGVGLTATNSESTALGRFNAPMLTEDVLVVGCGTAAGNRANAIRVTSDGGVVLGRAQGDISMGAYGN